MRTNPLRYHPDPHNRTGGANSRSDGPSLGAAARPDARGGDPNSVQTEQPTNDPDRPAGELRQDVMPDLAHPDGATPNPT